MTSAEAAAAIGRRVVYTAQSGAELHGEIRYVTGPYVWVRYARTLIAKATHPELLELEAA